MIIPLILALVAVGSVLFHVLSPWWWTPIASNWNYIDNTIIVTFWITGIAFVAIVLFNELLCVPLPPPGRKTGGL
jgi:cytochrome c oxidase subunit 2